MVIDVSGRTSLVAGLAVGIAALICLPVAGSSPRSPGKQALLTFSVVQAQMQRGNLVGTYGGGLCLANANGSHPLRLTDPTLLGGWPSWAPDGRRFAFVGQV